MEDVTQLLLKTIIFLSVVGKSASVNDAVVYDMGEGSEVSKLIQGCNRFSIQLLRTLSTNLTKDQGPRDLLFSPYNVWSALVVTYMGARGSTKHEMRKVLSLGNVPKAETWRTFKSLPRYNPHQLNETVHGCYNSANRIYFQKGTTLKKYIRKTLKKNVAFVDFWNNTEEARKRINTWVEKYTHRMIRNLMPPESIDKMTKMVIANAVYFKEAWLQPFELKKTVRRGFTTSYGEKIFVSMMSTKGVFLHGKSDELQCSILDLPYSDNRRGMIILLPNDRLRGVVHIVNNLTPEALRNVQESMSPTEVMVFLPKFKFEDTHELSSQLKEMGIRNLFDKRRINLSGFTGLKELKLDYIRHKTMIEVNEVGTEAAASTDIFYFKSAGPRGRIAFLADHPFIFLIQDYISNAILFIGVVNKPSEFKSH